MHNAIICTGVGGYKQIIKHLAVEISQLSGNRRQHITNVDTIKIVCQYTEGEKGQGTFTQRELGDAVQEQDFNWNLNYLKKLALQNKNTQDSSQRN